MTEKWGINKETLDAIRTKNMSLVQIAEAAAAGFGSPANLLPKEQVVKYLEGPELSIVLLELGRIAVDANKTLANSSPNPITVYKRLNNAADILKITTLDPHYQTAKNVVDVSKNGPHDFLTEGKRDYAKTIDAAGVLYPFEKGYFYVSVGKVLQDLYNNLPDDHPTKPLVAIEIELRKEMHGEKVDRNIVMQNYAELMEHTISRNPDRAATVSAWLIGLGHRTNDFDMEQAAFTCFSMLLKYNKNYLQMTQKEKKRKSKKWRDFVVNLGSVVIPEKQKNNLRLKLKV